MTPAILVAAYLSFVVGVLFGVAISRREGPVDVRARQDADYDRERREFEESFELAKVWKGGR